MQGRSQLKNETQVDSEKDMFYTEWYEVIYTCKK